MKKIGIFLFCLPIFLLAEEKNWKTQLGLSYVNTAGNSQTQTLSTKLGVDGSGLGNRYALTSNYVLAKSDGKENANKWNSELRAERVFTGRLFGFIAVTHLIDKYSGYNYRISVGPGLGIDLIKQEKQTLKGMASAMYYYDNYAVEGLKSDKYPTAKAALDFEKKLTETAQFKAKGDYLVSLEDSERYFITADVSLQVTISSNLAVGLGYQVAYQNLPPGPGIKKTDTTFLSSLVLNW
jgi:putative salt-induced outer membrane protein